MTTAVVPSDYMPALAEIWVMVMVCVTLLSGLFAKKDSSVTYPIGAIYITGCCGIHLVQLRVLGGAYRCGYFPSPICAGFASRHIKDFLFI